MNTEACLQWCRVHAGVKKKSGVVYRHLQAVLRATLTDSGGARFFGSGELGRILARRREAFEPIATELRRLAEAGDLYVAMEDLCRSYVHMHQNRLLGIDPAHEELVIGLLLRTLEGLACAPFSVGE